MAQYINKDALIGEIEKRIESCAKQREDMLNAQCYTLADDASARMGELNCIQNFLNTLEIKEVDLETAFAASIDHFDEKNKCGRWPESDLRDFAKHFFELGIKTKEE